MVRSEELLLTNDTSIPFDEKVVSIEEIAAIRNILSTSFSLPVRFYFCFCSVHPRTHSH